ncbi:MAG: peptide chain release factor N(5)-glutamine methyltransferase [Treponema sp.]|nr:peptide chain release factor N(5)-glutamine methyltransferase [Treponema sp.]
MLIREAIAQGSADLKYADIKSPGLDASILLAHILKTNRTSLVAAGNEKLSEKNCAAFCELIERRCNGECVAYIIGKKEFRNLDFSVNKSVLVPRPDTETLVEAAIEIINRLDKNETQINVLDLCTGSGAVAISLKNECPDLEIFATDICANALEVAKQNAKNLLGDNQIKFFLGDLFNALNCSNLCASVPPCENLPNNFSMIVSNPPYIPSGEIQTLSAEVQNEPRLALDGGKDGLEIIGRIIKEAPKYLRSKGYLLLEASPEQMENISILLEKNGFIDIKLYKDLSGSERVIGGMFEK